MKLAEIMPDRERYERFAARYQSETMGLITIWECSVCGYLTWVCSEPNKAKSVQLEIVPSRDPCPKCEEVRTRAPEIFHWVLNTIVKAQKDVVGGDKIVTTHSKKYTRKMVACGATESADDSVDEAMFAVPVKGNAVDGIEVRYPKPTVQTLIDLLIRAKLFLQRANREAETRHDVELEYVDYEIMLGTKDLMVEIDAVSKHKEVK